MEKEAIIKLTLSFFKSLKCELIWDNNAVLIKNVPKEFERLYEKSSPYIFVFDEESHKNNPDSELITKGSLLLKLMASYLENKAQTTILKIIFEPDLKQIMQNTINFKDYKIINTLKQENYELIYRFIFMTTLQYLNEKEQIMTQIYLSKNGLLDNFDLASFQTKEGKKQDTKKEKELIEETKANYTIAKENLKLKLQNRIKEISNVLNKSLDIALERINSHYTNRIGELNKEHNKNIENLNISREKILKANEKNKPILEDRIKRLEETIKNSKVIEEIEKLEKEKQFFINDEKNKHSINMNNSLMNTSIIYYPVYNFKIFIKGRNSLLKELKLEFNPLKNQLSKLFCDSCKQELKEIILCETGHLSCSECISICPRCGEKICKSCQDLKCNICGGKICSKCATLCPKCLKHVCNSDIKKDESTGKYICSNCAEFCSSCNKFSSKSSFKQCDSCRKKFCMNCTKSKYVHGIRKNLCESCASKVKPVKIDFGKF